MTIFWIITIVVLISALLDYDRKHLHNYGSMDDMERYIRNSRRDYLE